MALPRVLVGRLGFRCRRLSIRRCFSTISNLQLCTFVHVTEKLKNFHLVPQLSTENEWCSLLGNYKFQQDGE